MQFTALLLAGMAVSALTQTTSTVDIFLNNRGGEGALLGSVIGARSDRATYALECAADNAAICDTDRTVRDPHNTPSE